MVKKNPFLNVLAICSTVLALVTTACSSAPASAPAGNSGGQSSGSTSTSGGTEAAKPGGTLVFALNSDIVSLDPAFNYDFSTSPVVNEITEGLCRYDENMQLVGNLAEKWEMTDDKTYVYHLRKGVVFSDGSPMTVDDVVFSMERTRDPKTASYLGWLYGNVDKIEAVDDSTVKVTLKQPDAMWRYATATAATHVISKKYYEAHKDNFGKPDGGVLGTGPFKFVSWQTGSEIVLEKNENYWDKTGGPYLDKVVYKVIPEGTTVITGLKTGQINMAINLPLDLIKVVEGMDSVNVQKVDSYMNDAIEFNTQRPPFTDKKVRQAMNYALDKQKIIDLLVHDNGIAGHAIPVPPALWTIGKAKWEAAFKEIPDYAYNLEKAKQLLAESSVPNGFSAKILTDNDGLRINSALALQAAVKPLGINLEIEKVTGEELTTRGFSGSRDYDIIVNNWSSDFPDPSGTLLPLFHSDNAADGGANYANYKNPEVDKLLAEQVRLTDDEKRADLLIQAAKLIADDSPWVMLSHNKQIMATSKNVEGYKIVPLWSFQDMLKQVKMK
ncbi:ABC transporter substrate-binding protein [Brevibacillus fluminis]|uniref:ABC transporter substrate-binding protein n=1 Tax=Brevibacillus fluminis TaxID=511487 RepID=UPI003F89A7AB